MLLQRADKLVHTASNYEFRLRLIQSCSYFASWQHGSQKASSGCKLFEISWSSKQTSAEREGVRIEDCIKASYVEDGCIEGEELPDE